jgi:hypothetical protein
LRLKIVGKIYVLHYLFWVHYFDMNSVSTWAQGQFPCCHDRSCVYSETAALASSILPFKAALLMYFVL